MLLDYSGIFQIRNQKIFMYIYFVALLPPGFYTNKCRDNKNHVCCFSTTSDYYLKNTLTGNCVMIIIKPFISLIANWKQVLCAILHETDSFAQFFKGLGSCNKLYQMELNLE